jgi:dipeptidyl aminopeptidase/acylaminoacyl peptidase
MVLSLGQSARAEERQLRPYRVDDTFADEDVQALDVSPDGAILSFLKLRSRATPTGFVQATRRARGDIWIQKAAGQPPINITNGEADKSGWWNPIWSPKGEWLAFLSSRGGTVKLWGWQRRTGQLRKLSERGIDYRDFFGSSPCRWVAEGRVLCLALQSGQALKPLKENMGEAAELVTSAWAKAAKGELSVSVVESRSFNYETADLVLIDVARSTERVIAQTLLGDHMRAAVMGPDPWWLSNDGELVAYIRPAPVKNPADGIKVFSDAYDRWVAALDVKRIDGSLVSFKQPLPTDIVPRTVAWSGRSLVFWAYAGAVDRFPRMFRADTATGDVAEVPVGDLETVRPGRLYSYAPHAATATGDLIMLAARSGDARRDWWMIDRNGERRNLTANLKKFGPGMHPVIGDGFVFVADGEVWRLDVKGDLRNLTEQISEPIDRIEVTPSPGESPAAQLLAFVAKAGANLKRLYSAQSGRGRDRTGYYDQVYVVDATGTTPPKPISRPSPSADPICYSPSSGETLYFSRGWNGYYLWRVRNAEKSSEPLVMNAHRQSIARPDVREVIYSTPDGTTRRGVLVLPKGYVNGRRYPTAMTIRLGHGGLSAQGVQSGDESGTEELYTFAEAGYASFYIDDAGGADYRDQDAKALKQAGIGVQAAADELIKIGVADPDRLFLFGASGNGGTILKAITQTSRFKAAWAHVPGLAYGPDPTQLKLLDTYYRYRRNPHQYVTGLNRRRAGEPAKASEDPAEGSVLAQVDKISTPVLFVDGDLDGGLIAMNESLFHEFVYRGKTAQFVRYWGMEHEYGNTLAAARDLWQRVFAWFDDFGDVSRDSAGNLLFDGDRVKSRGGAPALAPEAFSRFGPASSSQPLRDTVPASH